MKNKSPFLFSTLLAGLAMAFCALTQPAVAQVPVAEPSAGPKARTEKPSKKQDLLIDSAEMVDFGLYRVQSGAKNEAKEVAGGLVVSYGNKLTQSTTQVAARKGASFGFRYRLIGKVKEADIRIRVLHPSELRDPKTGKRFLTSEWTQTVPLGQVNWNTGWLFEYDWEMVPGTWTIQLFEQDRLLLEKEFTVTVGKK